MNRNILYIILLVAVSFILLLQNKSVRSWVCDFSQNAFCLYVDNSRDIEVADFEPRPEQIEKDGFVFENQHGFTSVDGRYPDNIYSEIFFVYKMVSPEGQVSDSYYRLVMGYVPSHDELCNSEEEIALRKSIVTQDITFLNKKLIGLKSTLDVLCHGKKHNDIYEDYIKLKISDDVVKFKPEDMFSSMVDWSRELYMLAANNFENENSEMLAQDLRRALFAVHERDDEQKTIKFENIGVFADGLEVAFGEVSGYEDGSLKSKVSWADVEPLLSEEMKAILKEDD